MLSRLQATQRPTGTFSLNYDSAQAQGLYAWYPLQPSILTPYVYPSGQIAPFVERSLTGTVQQAAASIGGLCYNGVPGGSADGMSRTLTFPLPVPFTIACWHYPRTLNSQTCVYNTTVSGFVGWYLYDQGGTPSFQAFDGSTGTATATTSHVTNQWQHLVGVEYATNSRACFRNGAGKGTNTTTVAPGSPTNREEIGAIGGISSWDGLIADVRIYKRALSDAEVWALYDPRSRWDLYWQPNTRAYSFMSAIAAGTAGYLLVKN
jgi:hypothetical protein